MSKQDCRLCWGKGTYTNGHNGNEEECDCIPFVPWEERSSAALEQANARIAELEAEVSRWEDKEASRGSHCSDMEEERDAALARVNELEACLDRDERPGITAYRNGWWREQAKHAVTKESRDALAAELAHVREVIKAHSECVAVCEHCGEETPCDDDDVCRVLSSPSSAVDAYRARIRAEALDGIRESHAAIISELANIVRQGGPEKRRGPMVIYREPVMESVVRIRNAADAIRAIAAQPKKETP